MSSNKRENFSFLHFSDLHSHGHQGYDHTQALARLADFIEQYSNSLKCDYVFFTGDMANKGDYSNTIDFIKKLIKSISFTDTSGKDQKIFWSVGNHDIKRGCKMREDIINKIRTSQDPTKAFENEMANDESRTLLTRTGMANYINNYVDICGNEFPDANVAQAHRYFNLGKLNLYVLNTCLVSCDNNDDQNLFLAETKLYKLFENSIPGIPTIAIGHHGKEFFPKNEQSRITELFKDKIDMYLCGHSHRAAYLSFDLAPNEVHQITCGGGLNDNYSKLVFIRGEYNANENSILITPYSYAEKGDYSWGKDYRLHDKLHEDNNVFVLSRINTPSPMAKNDKNTILDTLLDKSRSYYDREASEGGRFSFLMHDDLLYTNIEYIEPKAVQIGDNQTSKERNKPQNIIECVATASDNVLFIGDGGMGKTMSLLRIWHNELVSKSSGKKIPLYIPLNEYNSCNSERFIHSFVLKNYRIDLDKYVENVNVLLLLDGFNEITKDTSNIVSEIKDYMVPINNIQVAMTSRYDFRTAYGFVGLKAYYLKPLDDNMVKAYLSKMSLGLPSDMMEVLRNPMMLTIYANNSICRKQIETRYSNLLSFSENQSVAGVLQNYMTCQIGKLAIDGEYKEIVKAAFAIQCIAPYVAHHMESNGMFSIPKSQLYPLIDGFLKNYGEAMFGKMLEALSPVMCALTITGIKYCDNDTNDYLVSLTNKHHIFIPDDTNYTFRHQYFRDYLSASHIKMVLEKHDYSHTPAIPTELSGRAYSPGISKMLGECLGEHANKEFLTQKTVLHKAIEEMRGKECLQNDYTLNNVINVWKHARSNNIIGEDLSRLDLTSVPMNGLHFSNKEDVCCFDETKLSANTLLPLGHTAELTSASFSPQGERILTTSNDGTAKIWNTYTTELLQSFEGHDGFVKSASFSNDGGRIITASTDKTAKIWNAQTGELLHTLKGHDGWFESALFDNDGKKAITTSVDNTVKIWEVKSGKLIRTLERHGNELRSASFSRDGKYILTAPLDTAMIWNAKNGDFVRKFKEHDHYALNNASFSPDGKLVVTTNTSEAIARIWNVETGELMRTLDGYMGIFTSASFSPDESSIVTASWNTPTRVWNVKTGELEHTFAGLDSPVTCAVFSPDSKRVATASMRKILIWDVESGEQVLACDEIWTLVPCVSFSCDGSRIITTSLNSVKIRDAKTGELIRDLREEARIINGVAFCSNDKLFVTSDFPKKEITIWDVESGKPLRTLNGERCDVTANSFNAERSLIVTVSDNAAKIWNIKSGELLRTINGQQDELSHALLISDGKQIATTAKDTVQIWDVESGKILHTLRHRSVVTNVCFSNSGLMIVAASLDNTAVIWNAETGEVIKTIRIYPGMYMQGCTFRNAKFSSENLETIIRQHGGVLV